MALPSRNLAARVHPVHHKIRPLGRSGAHVHLRHPACAWGRLRGSTILPSVEARLLLVKPDTVDITLRVGSFYGIHVNDPSNYVGV
jgi:hypothetical protein